MSYCFTGTKPWGEPISTPLIVLIQLKPASSVVCHCSCELLTQVSTHLAAVVVLDVGVKLLESPLVRCDQQAIVNYWL